VVYCVGLLNFKRAWKTAWERKKAARICTHFAFVPFCSSCREICNLDPLTMEGDSEVDTRSSTSHLQELHREIRQCELEVTDAKEEVGGSRIHYVPFLTIRSNILHSC
jgi:hypothetical protein